ncbi:MULTISPECIES: Wzz/FepE/Etk N-terminal domain-containing protein [Pseudomonas]|uniref:Chain-length determining protein n=1 Tax=Pseudomonas cedrina TaxID=651740 RepID=A0A2S9D3L2_PSECE|nr:MULTISPECIES: Wzz/FepE/Etk N-terminal domain-containing protein [Pseudomonas]AVJ21847.1 chain-length determining protein [Pseudomonas sp. MYb193]PRB87689.1 chain-length determining protein [Pseudomonas cedrina]
MSSSFRTPPITSSYEIDLVALVQAFWKQKKLIMLTTASFGVVAAACAFLMVPEYQVSSVLRPAAINELDALNRSEVYKLPPGEALIKVGASLESYETRLGFFRENQELFKRFERPGRSLEQSFDEFNRDALKLVLPDPKKADLLSAFIGLELNYAEHIDGVRILNSFVKYAIDTERENIAADLKVIVSNRLAELQGKIEAARSSYQTGKEARITALEEADNIKRAQLQDELRALRLQLKTGRMDRISLLTEAISIAKSLNIQKPTTPSALGESGRFGETSIMRTEINNQQIPLYFMGVEALEAERSALQRRKADDFTEGRIAQIARELDLLKSNREIEILKQRQNEDLFLQGVEPLRAEITRLHNLGSLDISNMKLVAIDRQALEPLAPIRPKRTLFIIFGLLIGGIVGVGIASARCVFYGKCAGEREMPMLAPPLQSKSLKVESEA